MQIFALPSRGYWFPKLQASSTPYVTQFKTKYLLVIGLFLYLTILRPDISFAHLLRTNQVNLSKPQCSTSPSQVTCRLPEARTAFFSYIQYIYMQAYTDADWAKSVDTRRSTTGYYIFIGNSPISWKSKKQSIASRLLAEAEYYHCWSITH